MANTLDLTKVSTTELLKDLQSRTDVDDVYRAMVGELISRLLKLQ